MARDGRPTIFRSPGDKVRYQGLVSAEGARLFEQARLRLANIVHVEIENVSDGAVMEYLARGDRETRAHVKRGKA